ncbi:hypothetical protein ACWPKS_10470 [Coraliomargarita sp. W4R72]
MKPKGNRLICLVLVLISASAVCYPGSRVQFSELREKNDFTFDNSTLDLIVSSFDAYYYAALETGCKINLEEHWYLTGEETLREMDGLGPAVHSSFNCLFLKDQTVDNFELVMRYRNVTGNDGWIGILFGVADSPSSYNTPSFVGRAHAAFMQRGGRATYKGVGFSSFFQTDYIPDYGLDEWHSLRIVVRDRQLEMYVDDSDAPALSKTINQPHEGKIALFSSGRAQAEIQYLAIQPLK